MSDPGVLQLSNRYESVLRRLPTLVALLVLISIPVVAVLFTEGVGTPALLAAWRIGFLCVWAIAFIGVLHCGVSLLRLRTNLQRQQHLCVRDSRGRAWHAGSY